MVYFADLPGRQTVEEIQARYPRVCPVSPLTPASGSSWCDRRRMARSCSARTESTTSTPGGSRARIRSARFGPHAAADLRRHDRLPHVGDIVVISRLDESTDEVAAFEELVGCHGGLGGWQTRPVLVHPADWPVEGALDGADAVHRQLVHWLEQLGQREDLRSSAATDEAGDIDTSAQETPPAKSRPWAS